MNDLTYLSTSCDEVYLMMGGIGMRYYYVPVLEKKYKNSKDFVVYDFSNKIEIKATINSAKTSDVDLETSVKQIDSTKVIATMQFTLESIKPHEVKVLDRIHVEYVDGRKKDFLIVGIDNGVLLHSVYTSVRVFELDTAFTEFQWEDR